MFGSAQILFPSNKFRLGTLLFSSTIQILCYDVTESEFADCKPAFFVELSQINYKIGDEQNMNNLFETTNTAYWAINGSEIVEGDLVAVAVRVHQMMADDAVVSDACSSKSGAPLTASGTASETASGVDSAKGCPAMNTVDDGKVMKAGPNHYNSVRVDELLRGERKLREETSNFRWPQADLLGNETQMLH